MYVRVSVASEEGINNLVTTIIDKCIELETQVAGVNSSKKQGTDSIFTLGGSDGLTSGDVKNINPMKL